MKTITLLLLAGSVASASNFSECNTYYTMVNGLRNVRTLALADLHEGDERLAGDCPLKIKHGNTLYYLKREPLGRCRYENFDRDISIHCQLK